MNTETGASLAASAPARPDAAAAQAHFAERGYWIARGLFSRDEMQDVIGEIQGFGENGGRGEVLDRGAMRFYSDLFHKSARVRAFLAQERLVAAVCAIAGPDLWVRWDQAVAKGPDSGVFAWHQDNGYNRLPQQHFQVWVALSEMRRDNGGLWLVPGSHHRHIRHRQDGRHFAAEGSEIYDADDAPKVFIEAEAGDVVIFSSLTLHKTYENTTDRARWAYVAEVMRLSDFDPTVDPPYFVLARNGAPAPGFIDRLPGSRDPRQIALTLPLAARRALAPMRSAARRALSRT